MLKNVLEYKIHLHVDKCCVRQICTRVQAEHVEFSHFLSSSDKSKSVCRKGAYMACACHVALKSTPLSQDMFWHQLWMQECSLLCGFKPIKERKQSHPGHTRTVYLSHRWRGVPLLDQNPDINSGEARRRAGRSFPCSTLAKPLRPRISGYVSGHLCWNKSL